MKYEPKLIEVAQKGDEKGYLVVCEESGKDIPFEIKRIYIYMDQIKMW